MQATKHLAVTPSDSEDISTEKVQALYIGTGGNVNVIDNFGNTVLYKNVISGFVLPIGAKRVKATSTTATDIVALF